MSFMVLLFACFPELPVRNFPPELEIQTEIDGTIHREGSPIEVELLLSDGSTDLKTLELLWQSDLDGIVFEGVADTDGSITIAVQSLRPGLHRNTIRVSDDEGLSSTASFSLQINQAPQAPQVTVLPENPTTGDDLTVRIEGAFDLEDDPLTFQIEWMKDGIVTEAGSDELVPASETSKDQVWTVQVTPSDALGEGESTETSVTIGNTPPVIEDDSVVISPSTSVTAQSQLICSGMGTDVDEPNTELTTSYTWQRAVNDFLTDFETVGEAFELSPEFVQPRDKIYCQVTVTDSDGLSSSASEWVIVENTLPEFSYTLIDTNGAAIAGSTLNCAALAYDPDLTEITYTYVWKRNGSTSALGAALELTEFNAIRGDIYTCEITATDGHNGARISTVDVTIANTPPVIDTVTISPLNPTSEDSISCLTTSSDLDGDPVTISHQWLKNGVVDSTQTAESYTGELTAGDQLTCRATPSDSTDSGLMVESTVIVANAPPVVQSIQFSQANIFTDTLLEAEVVATDSDTSDSLQLTYDWYVNGSLVQSGISNSLSGAQHFDRGDAVFLNVTASDGLASHQLSTDSLTVENSPPVLSMVSIEEYTVLSDLHCGIPQPATDPDGDAVSYETVWTLNGQVFDYPYTLIHSNDSVNASYANFTEEWTCTVTPFDGIEVGTPASGTTQFVSCPIEPVYDIVTGFDDIYAPHQCWETGFSLQDDAILLLPFTYANTSWVSEEIFNRNGSVTSFEWFGSEDMPWYFTNYNHVEGIMRNRGGAYAGLIGYTPFRSDDATISANSLNVLPSDNVYFRWTAPLDAVCDFNISMVKIDSGVSDGHNTFRLSHNQSLEVFHELFSLGESFSDLITLPIYQGDQIDFVVGTEIISESRWVKLDAAINCDFTADPAEFDSGLDTGL